MSVEQAPVAPSHQPLRFIVPAPEQSRPAAPCYPLGCAPGSPADDPESKALPLWAYVSFPVGLGLLLVSLIAIAVAKKRKLARAARIHGSPLADTDDELAMVSRDAHSKDTRRGNGDSPPKLQLDGLRNDCEPSASQSAGATLLPNSACACDDPGNDTSRLPWTGRCDGRATLTYSSRLPPNSSRRADGNAHERHGGVARGCTAGRFFMNRSEHSVSD
jgi:hypothetical protein